MPTGHFITLEGIDGSGKSTHLNLVSTILNEHAIEHLVTREPGGTRLGERLRAVLLDDTRIPVTADAELLLIFAARAQHLAEVIVPTLQQGRWVVCDRFTDATYAYQGGGSGVADQRIAAIEQWVQQGMQPELTLLLDVPVELGRQRTGTRTGQLDRFESRDARYRHAVREAYLRAWERAPQRIHRIDASQSLESVGAQIRTVLSDYLLP
jgi:dTMP kinase